MPYLTAVSLLQHIQQDDGIHTPPHSETDTLVSFKCNYNVMYIPTVKRHALTLNVNLSVGKELGNLRWH